MMRAGQRTARPRRVHVLRGLAGALMVMSALSCGKGGGGPQGAAGASPSGHLPGTSVGIYSGAQADRGEGRFQSVCQVCHSPNEFADDAFKERLQGVSVLDFFEYVRTNMPWREPNTLSPQQYIDVVAYIMRLNGYPEGTQELPLERTLLERLRFATGPSS